MEVYMNRFDTLYEGMMKGWLRDYRGVDKKFYDLVMKVKRHGDEGMVKRVGEIEEGYKGYVKRYNGGDEDVVDDVMELVGEVSDIVAQLKKGMKG